jgi:hypothetical protein
MTTAATVVAMIPLLIAGGAGAASRFAIGVVIAAGMTIGTLFTLFVTPAVYTYLARDHQKAGAAVSAAPAEAGDSPPKPPAEAGFGPAEPTPAGASAVSPAGTASSSQGPERRAAKRPGRRRRFSPAAE